MASRESGQEMVPEACRSEPARRQTAPGEAPGPRPAVSIELLAPARDRACGQTAIACGADAVYIGGPAFGARAAAANTLEDIRALTEYAHGYWARVYVALNTLLRDDELDDARRLVAALYELGVDGLIVQDVGLLELDLPPLPLIASTQMHNHTAERVAFLERVGFQRAILARELELRQIAAIRAATAIELECFVHGALCVGYSGQCYLSYALGGRSGNRGQCAQPCRKAYTLRDASGRVLAADQHLLSLQDLDLSAHLGALLDAGVTAFKIEGRLKDRAYVANVVAYYRQRLDQVLAARGLRRSSSGRSECGFAPDPRRTFHRGGTTFFLHGKGERVGATATPKAMGERLGPVHCVRGAVVEVGTDTALHPGDGLCFFDAGGRLAGTSVRAVAGTRVTVDSARGIEPGTVLFRNRDHRFVQAVAASRPQRRIAVHMVVQPTAGGLRLVARDEDGNVGAAEHASELVPARRPEAARAAMQRQLAATGNTPFACAGVEVALQRPAFLPLAALNALRRQALAALLAARAAARPVQRGGALRNEVPFPEPVLSFTGNVLNGRARAFYQRHGVVRIEPAAESGLDLRGRQVMTTRYCVRHQLGLCPEQDPAQRAEPLLLTDAEGHTLELRFECGRCGMAVFLRDRQAELAAPCGGARAPRAARRRSPAERRQRSNRRGR